MIVVGKADDDACCVLADAVVDVESDEDMEVDEADDEELLSIHCVLWRVTNTGCIEELLDVDDSLDEDGLTHSVL